MDLDQELEVMLDELSPESQEQMKKYFPMEQDATAEQTKECGNALVPWTLYNITTSASLVVGTASGTAQPHNPHVRIPQAALHRLKHELLPPNQPLR